MHSDLEIKKINIPRNARELIPIRKLYDNGITKNEDGKYSMSFALKDINYLSLGDEERKLIFDRWSEIISSFDIRTSYKLSICNRRINKKDVLNQRLISYQNDGYDELRKELNKLTLADIQGDKGFIQDKYLTVTTTKMDYTTAESYLLRHYRDINRKLQLIDSSLTPVTGQKKMELIYDFFHYGREGNLGTVDFSHFKDQICPDYFKPSFDCFEAGGKFGCSLIMKSLGSSLKDEFFCRLAEIKTNMFISLDILPISNEEAQKIIDSKDDCVEISADGWSNRRSIKQGSAIRLPRNIKRSRKIIDDYQEDMDEYNQRMQMIELTAVILADNKDELDNFIGSFIDTASEYNCQMIPLYFQQYKGLQNALPFGVRTIDYLRDSVTDTTSIMLPFASVNINHVWGIPYGRHEDTLQQQLVDRRLLLNGHEWIFGTTGAGKSANAKLKAVYEAIMTDCDIVFIDPHGEYAPLVKSLGGNIINVGKDSINIADVTDGYSSIEEEIQNKSDIIMTFLESILDDNAVYGEREKSLVDRACREVYKSYFEGYSSMITLTDVYDYLMQLSIPAAEELALSIERHVLGSFNCFSKPTSVSINSRIVCYNLSSLPKQMIDAGMIVVLSHIDNRLRSNRKSKRLTMIKIDEMDYFFKHKTSSMAIENFFEMSRKYGGYITAIVQNISKVLNIPEACTMIGNAENIIMLRQEPADANKLAEMYGLSDIQVRKLVTAEDGHGINKIGNIIYPFDGTIPEDSAVYKLIDTKIKRNEAV